MKKYIVHVHAPFPLTIEDVTREGISKDFAERIELLEDENTIGTIILSVDPNNPNEDELTDLILMSEDTEFGVYLGFPNDDNCVNFQDCMHLLDSCEVTE